MPFERKMEAAFVHYRWRDEFTKLDLLAISRELPEMAERLGYAPNVLHTFPANLGGEIEPWAVFEHSIRRRNTILKNLAKVAWVAREPHLLAVGRMLQELNRNPQIEIQVFRSEVLARRWLSSSERARESRVPAKPAAKRRAKNPKPVKRRR